MTIDFYSVNTRSWLKNRKLLKRFIEQLFRSHGKQLEQLRIIFCTDNYLLQINQEYLDHNEYTDIITFDLDPEGEIYISLDRVRQNAQAYGDSVTTELHRVIFHGILHLCGYRDKSVADAKEMRAKEDEYLQKYSQFVSRETHST